MNLPANTVVIDVSGGVVQDVFTGMRLNIILVDWDNIEDGDTAGLIKTASLQKLSLDTQLQIEEGLKKSGKKLAALKGRMWAKEFGGPAAIKIYHWFVTPPLRDKKAEKLPENTGAHHARVGKAACGALVRVFWSGVQPMPVDSMPQPDKGYAGICHVCACKFPDDFPEY